ncbi:hypothetical protein LWC35_22645 [Pseudonocardia kujensis]|uniref:hypothetical protein n=1 Tax=Pseudonocardia kujensis TaxID=1128675 RepID=UPI001E4593AB|nr:hypothetical protein [Pseudonocardia kujensis]MCE0765681.1 hypothetical protein [Pseudonocardia kujensis]
MHPGPPPRPAAPRLTRRRALSLGLAAGGLGLAAPVLAGCAAASSDDGPDPLIPLVTRARSDAALVTAVITADPSLTGQLDPLRSARTDHATALEQEIARVAGTTAPATPAPAPTAPQAGADLDAVRQAVADAAREAAGLVGSVPTARAGLVGSVAACCAAYTTVLGAPQTS